MACCTRNAIVMVVCGLVIVAAAIVLLWPATTSSPELRESFDYNYLGCAGAANGGKVCLLRYASFGSPTDLDHANQYNAKLQKSCPPPSQQQTPQMRLVSLARDLAAQRTAAAAAAAAAAGVVADEDDAAGAALPAPPHGFLKTTGGTVYFLSADMVGDLVVPDANSFDELHVYYPCATQCIQPNYPMHYATVMGSDPDAHKLDELQVWNSTNLLLGQAKLIAQSTESCSGFTCKLVGAAGGDNQQLTQVVFQGSIDSAHMHPPAQTPIDHGTDIVVPEDGSIQSTLAAPVFFEKGGTAIRRSPKQNHYLAGLSDTVASAGFPADGTRTLTKKGSEMLDTDLAISSRRPCDSNDHTDRECCRTTAAATSMFKLTFGEDDGAQTTPTCPVYIDSTGDVYERQRGAKCCQYASSRSPSGYSFAVSNRAMHDGDTTAGTTAGTWLKPTPKNGNDGCDMRPDSGFFQPACNTKCQRLAKADPSSSRDGGETWPSLYRRDLGRCIYDQHKPSDPYNHRCTLPTHEACQSEGFKEECGAVCREDCQDPLDTAVHPRMRQYDISDRKYEANNRCTPDGWATYSNRGNIVGGTASQQSLVSGLNEFTTEYYGSGKKLYREDTDGGTITESVFTLVSVSDQNVVLQPDGATDPVSFLFVKYVPATRGLVLQKAGERGERSFYIGAADAQS